MMNKCLFCYQALSPDEDTFHSLCAKRIFGIHEQPELPVTENDLLKLAKELIQNRTSLTGVQAKISLHLNDTEQIETKHRFTIVGLWGEYILKPSSADYAQLPEVEDLSMHLAQIAGIKTAEHCLIPLKSGSLAYITKRMDRDGNRKWAMEDMCQLSERLTEEKYNGSYEQIAKVISKFSTQPGLDLIFFYEIVLFSFLTGNADMHLKNFSLIERDKQGMILSPAYDLVNTTLVNPSDREELALTLNGKKRRISKDDFKAAMYRSGLNENHQRSVLVKLKNSLSKWDDFIDQSFLTDDFKHAYKEIIARRAKVIF